MNLSNAEIQVSQRATEFLQQMGITPRYAGYGYLREAIVRTAADWSALFGLTKVLYPEIARKYKTTPNAVERSIRYVILAIWEIPSKREVFKSLSGYQDSDRPTNKEFIGLLADQILLEMFQK